MTRPPSVRERTVTVSAGAVRVFSTPAAAGAPAYVLVHGIGMSHRYLTRLHAELAGAGAEVHAVDLPGFGDVPAPDTDLDIPAMADALAEALEAAAIPPAVIVGQSMGTQWATELTVRHPARARAVVLIGPVADERHRTVLRQCIALAVDTLREPPGANLLVLADYLRCGVTWYLAQLRHMLAYPLEERVARLTVPVVVVRGGRDPIAGAAWARRLAAAAERGASASVPGHAHNVQHSAPRAAAGALRDLLARMLP